jgi:hypothetical protein
MNATTDADCDSGRSVLIVALPTIYARARARARDA